MWEVGTKSRVPTTFPWVPCKIRILVLLLITVEVHCLNEYEDQNNVHLKQISSNEESPETITSYSTNLVPNSQTMSSVNIQQYHIGDDSNKVSDHHRLDRGRIRKIFRIKNPFLQPEDDANEQSVNKNTQDIETEASNQYAAMQYSLPPEEFLKQMRAENQYHQQQQQISTPAPTFGYTATPQPQYQYSTLSTSAYNNGNQQMNMSPLMEPKNPSQVYTPNLNTNQYNNAYSYGIDTIQSTPSSVTLYLSTSSPNNQYIEGPSSNYVSSSSPMYLSSPTNLLSYSSTLPNIQTGSPSYNPINRYSSTADTNIFNYGSNNRNSDSNMQVNHYENSANGFGKVSMNMQQQYINEFPSSTQLPTSSSYPDTERVNWQNSAHLNYNNLANLRQEAQTQQQIFQNNIQDSLQNSNVDSTSSDNNRIGSMPSANNLFVSFVQPDYQTFTDLKNRDKDMEQSKVSEVYSHGDYGWKIDGRKPLIKYDVNFQAKYPKQQNSIHQIDSSSISSPYHYVDNGKTYNYDQTSKYNSEKLGQEFAKAAAKSQENMNKQLNIYLNNPQNVLTGSDINDAIFRNNNNNQKSFTNDNSNNYKTQSDMIKGGPYYYSNSQESMKEVTTKQRFEEDKVSQNSVKTDVFNNNQVNNVQKNIITDSHNGYISTNDSNLQNFNQAAKTVSDSYFKDKNIEYGYNTRTTPAENIPSDDLRRLELTNEQPKNYEPSLNFKQLSFKPQTNGNVPSYQYITQQNLDNVQLQNNVQHQSLQRPQNQASSDSISLKLNDIPYWLTQGLHNLRFSHMNGNNNGIIPTGTPLTLNQNVDSHQIDVAASILNKLIRDKQAELSSKPEHESQRETLLPTINGFKVVNPYNLDLKLVTEILKGRTPSNDFNVQTFRNPLPWELSHLQQIILNSDVSGQYRMPDMKNDGVGTASSPFFEVRNMDRYPYQGVKYSRSQEEQESLIPITDTTHIHPIGSVIEQDDMDTENREAREADETETTNDVLAMEIDGDRSRLHSHYRVMNRNRHPNSLTLSDRQYLHRKLPKSTGEPYPLLKPPAIHPIKGRSRSKVEYNRRQRGSKYRLSRIAKREQMFDAESFDDDTKPTVPTLLRPPPPAAIDKSDTLDTNES
ncbi:homeobox protein 2-like [Battus philenor]|uniref:homeobox protein 2-like n=1 Tax=Battus philenor TaxID=42288 RepID=UPI0035CF1164